MKQYRCPSCGAVATSEQWNNATNKHYDFSCKQLRGRLDNNKDRYLHCCPNCGKVSAGQHISEHNYKSELLEALKDMLSGWKYIREVYGDLPGVEWDRAQRAALEAIRKAEGGD